MHHLHTVYNTINDSPQSVLHLIIISTAFLVAVFFCVVMYRGRGRKAKITLNTGDKVNPFLMALLPITFVFLIYAYIDALEINIYYRDKAILSSSELKTVEGYVKDFHPQSDTGHGYEYFYVNGVGFAYGKYEEAIGGYHLTVLDGGKIRSGLYVRIGYYPTDFRNIILKLETE